MTEGVIWKQILAFFFPILIGTFFQQLYNTTDAVMVGQFAGKDALSCVSGSAGQITSFVVGFYTGLSTGATVIIARFYGAKDEKGLQHAIHTAYAFAVLGGVLIGIAGIVLSPQILECMNTPAELMDQSVLFLRIYFGSIIFVFVYNMGSAILRAAGDARRPLFYLILCCLLNILLDFVFVFFMKMSVAGAGIATFISQAVSAVLVTRVLLLRTDVLKLRIENIGFHWETLRKILKIGLPTGIQSSMYSISNIIIQAALNRFGVDTVAAWGAFGKIDALVWMVYAAFGMALTTFAGQNYGARKWERIGKSVRLSLVMSFVSISMLSALILLFGRNLMSIFINDANVISIGLRMMGVISPAYCLFAFIEIFSAVLQAEGDVLIPALLTFGGTCLFRIIWVLFLVPGGTLEQIIFCYPMTWATCAVLFIFYYRWRQKQILQKAEGQ